MKIVLTRGVVFGYFVVQLLGVLLVFFWEKTHPANLGIAMWITSWFLLFPGDIISSLLCQRFLWAYFSVEMISKIAIVLGVVINTLFFLGLGLMLQKRKQRKI